MRGSPISRRAPAARYHAAMASPPAPETPPPAVAAPTVEPKAAAAERAELEPRYHLVLLDDDDHSYAYVVEMLGRLLGYSREKAFGIAAVVDSQGRAIVETAGYDSVSRHQQLIHGYGPDPRVERCSGSMSAVLEEAP